MLSKLESVTLFGVCLVHSLSRGGGERGSNLSPSEGSWELSRWPWLTLGVLEEAWDSPEHDLLGSKTQRR